MCQQGVCVTGYVLPYLGHSLFTLHTMNLSGFQRLFFSFQIRPLVVLSFVRYVFFVVIFAAEGYTAVNAPFVAVQAAYAAGRQPSRFA